MLASGFDVEMATTNEPPTLPMKSSLNCHYLVPRVILGISLCFNYFTLTKTVFRHQHIIEGSFLEGTAPPPTGWGHETDRNAPDASGMDEAARRDLLDCGIIDLNETDDPSSRSCDLIDPRWGTPTILISLGRSGSSATWQLMSSMAGNHTFRATEDTGSSTEMSVHLFTEVFDRHADGKCWIHDFLCRHQGENRMRAGGGLPMAGLYGFKWKPYAATFGSDKSVEALRWLSRNPHVKVVHSRRNPLDVIISRYKHRDRSVAAHCAVGDDACSELHRNAKPTLPTREGRLINLIDEIMEESGHADRLLTDLRVPHVDVSYEELYFAPDIAVEWRRLFSFLGTEPSDGRLKSSDLVSRMEHQATSNHSTSVRGKVRNHEEVEEILRGTEYEIFLSGGG